MDNFDRLALESVVQYSREYLLVLWIAHHLHLCVACEKVDKLYYKASIECASDPNRVHSLLLSLRLLKIFFTSLEDKFMFLLLHHLVFKWCIRRSEASDKKRLSCAADPDGVQSLLLSSSCLHLPFYSFTSHNTDTKSMCRISIKIEFAGTVCVLLTWIRFTHFCFPLLPPTDDLPQCHDPFTCADLIT